MKKLLFFLAFDMVLHSLAFTQCYEPNIRKADAAYSRGDWQSAYEFYKHASKCHDAKNFENGKNAKAGMQKCLPVLKVDGQKAINLTVGKEAGERTFKVTSSKLDSEGWKIGSTQNCEVVNIDHQSNTITIKWGEYQQVGNRNVSFYISGSGVEYVSASVAISQQGYSDETITLPQGYMYDTVIKGSSGISFVMYHGKYGFIDSTGTPITPLKYTYVEKSGWSHGETETFWGKCDLLLRVFNKGKFGYINRQGVEVIPLIYEYIEKSSLRHNSSFSIVKREGKFGLVNGMGEEIIPCSYSGFRSNYLSDIYPVAFEKNDKWAFFEKNGKQLTDFKYDYVDIDFFCGKEPLCKVEQRNKHGYVNLKGECVISPQFEWARRFIGDNAIVKQNGKYGLISSKGNIIVPCKYDDYWMDCKNRFLWVKEKGRIQMIDSVGNEICSYSYKQYQAHKHIGRRIYFLLSRTNHENIIVGNWGKEYSSVEVFKADFDGLKESAEKGNHGSQLALGKKYYYGEDCQKNYTEALKYFSLAAYSESEALRYLSWMLWHGQGCQIDKEAAMDKMRLAIQQGNEMAYKQMKELGMVIKDI